MCNRHGKEDDTLESRLHALSNLIDANEEKMVDLKLIEINLDIDDDDDDELLEIDLN